MSVRSAAEGGLAAQAVSSLVSGNFFSVLGAQPILGRSSTARDTEAPDSNPVAVVSYRYWQEVLGADRSAIGQQINVLIFTFGVSLTTGIPFGIAPALRGSRSPVAPTLTPTTRTSEASGGQSTPRLSKILVATQVKLSPVLLVAAGLFLPTLENLRKQNFGFERHNLLLVQFNAKLAGYKSEQRTNLYDRMLARLNALPGVRSAALSGTPPIHAGSWNSPHFH